MDLSGAQLNSAAISAYNAQLQTAAQQNQQSRPEIAATPDRQPNRQPDREVTLSREGRDLAAREEADVPPAEPARAAPVASVEPAPIAEQPRPVEAAAAPQSPSLSSTSYSARIAAESYYSVANF